MEASESSDNLVLTTSRGKDISFDEAVAEEQDMLVNLTLWQKREEFYTYLNHRKDKIKEIVSHQLSLRRNQECQLLSCEDWIHGSFNICCPLRITNWQDKSVKRMIIRFPLPYKVGEEAFPGNADEKLRCEAATYVWIAENCPGVPIPRLWGFAFSNNYSVRSFLYHHTCVLVTSGLIEQCLLVERLGA